MPKKRATRSSKQSSTKGDQLDPVTVLRDEPLDKTAGPMVFTATASSRSMAKRRPFAPIQTNVPTPPCTRASENKATVADDSAEYQERVLAVQQVCDAIDREVECRSAAIRAITTAQLSSFRVQMDLQMSKFSSHTQHMPLLEFLKSCPGIESVTSYDGTIKLQREASPRLQESKRNLHDILAKATDNMARKNSTSYFTPNVNLKMSARQPLTVDEENKVPEKGVQGEDLSWPQYYERLQGMGLARGIPDSVGRHRNSTVSLKARPVKLGETLLSINGSPLRLFGNTPANKDGREKGIRLSSRLGSTRRTLRDL